jgi:hypothetical protein
LDWISRQDEFGVASRTVSSPQMLETWSIDSTGWLFRPWPRFERRRICKVWQRVIFTLAIIISTIRNRPGPEAYSHFEQLEL